MIGKRLLIGKKVISAKKLKSQDNPSEADKTRAVEFSEQPVQLERDGPEVTKHILSTIPSLTEYDRTAFYKKARVIARRMESRFVKEGQMFSAEDSRNMLKKVRALIKSCQTIESLYTTFPKNAQLLALLLSPDPSRPVPTTPRKAIDELTSPLNDLACPLRVFKERAIQAEIRLSAPTALKRRKIVLKAINKLHKLWIDRIDPKQGKRPYSKAAFTKFVNALLPGYDSVSRDKADFKGDCDSVWQDKNNKRMRGELDDTRGGKNR